MVKTLKKMKSLKKNLRPFLEIPNINELMQNSNIHRFDVHWEVA